MPTFPHKNHVFLSHSYRHQSRGDFWHERKQIFVESDRTGAESSRESFEDAFINEIKKGSKRLEEKIRKIETVDIPGIEKRYSNEAVSKNLKQKAKDEKEKEVLELKKQKEIHLRAIKHLRTTIETEPDFREALYDIGNAESLLNAIKTKRFNQNYIKELLESDLSALFSESILDRLNVSQGLIETQDEIMRVGTNPEETGGLRFEKEAFKEWEERISIGIQQKIKELTRAKKEKEIQLKGSPRQGRNKIQTGIDQIEHTIESLQKEQSRAPEERVKYNLGGAKPEWVIHRIRQKERGLGRTDLTGNNQYIAALLGEIEPRIQEWRIRHIERIKEYLRKDMDALKEARDRARNKGAYRNAVFEKIDSKVTTLEAEFNYRGLHENLQTRHENGELKSDEDSLKDLRERLITERQGIEQDIQNAEYAHDNREQIVAEIQKKSQRMTEVLERVTPDHVDRLKRLIVQPESGLTEAAVKRAIEGVTYTYKGQNRQSKGDIDELLSPEGLAEKTVWLNMQLSQLSTMSPAELLTFQRNLAQMDKAVDLFSKIDQHLTKLEDKKYQAVLTAGYAIDEIMHAQNTEEIYELFKEPRFQGHIDWLNNDEWKNYHGVDIRKKTADGMAFYQHGAEWKVLIKKNHSLDLNKVKRMLRHEFRHVQHQNSDEVSGKFRDMVVESDAGRWQKIKHHAIAHFKSEGKEPPVGTDWEQDNDAYVLNELYAMHADLIEKRFDIPEPPRTHMDWLIKHLNEINLELAGESLDSGNLEQALKDLENKGHEISGFADVEGSGVDTGIPMAGKGKETLKKGFSQHTETIEELSERIKELKKYPLVAKIPNAKGYLGLVEKLHNKTIQINQHYASGGNMLLSSYIQERIEAAQKYLGNVDDIIIKLIGEVDEGGGDFIRNWWNSTIFLSANSVLQAGKIFIEFYTRRIERREVHNGAKFLEGVAGGLEVANEAAARSQQKEEEEVNEWKGKYSQYDLWALRKELKGMAGKWNPNKDRFKALLRAIAEKGDLDWRNQDLWRAINNMQKTVRLEPGDPVLLSRSSALREKMRSALGSIYDYAEFNDLDRSNGGSYSGEKSKNESSFSENFSETSNILNKMLAKSRRKEPVDPAEFEFYLEASIRDAKCYAEAIMYYLIMGMAEGLLRPDRFKALNKYSNNWPVLDWINKEKPTRKNFEKLAKKYFPEDYESGKPDDQFMDFFWNVAMNDEEALSRTRASVTNRQWDHDWGRTISSSLDAGNIKVFFSGRSGQQETKDTAVQNYVGGVLQWGELNSKKESRAKNPKWRENFTDRIAAFAMADGILNRAYKKHDPNMGRYTTKGLNTIPREASIGNHRDWSTQKHRDKLRSFVDVVDSYFFSNLRNTSGQWGDEKFKTKALVGHLQDQYGTNKRVQEILPKIRQVDDIFENIDEITKGIIESRPSKLNEAVDFLRIGLKD